MVKVAGVVAVAVQPVGTVRLKAALRSGSPPAGFAEVVVTVNAARPGTLGRCGHRERLVTAIGVEPVTPSTLTRIVAAPTAMRGDHAGCG